MLQFSFADWRLFKVFLFLILSSGCTLINTPGSTREESTTKVATAIVPVTSESDGLTGTRWELVAFEGTETVPTISEQPQPFIEFNQGILVLRNTCNHPAGQYLLDNDQITITSADMTAMDCSDDMDPAIMEVESAFFAAMLTFESYSIDGDQLRIQYADGEMLFHRLTDTSGSATAVVPVTSEPDPLTGTRWELVAIEDQEAVAYTPEQFPEEERLFIEFNQGGLTLRNGCNSPSGHYLLKNDQITMTFSEMTAMDCSDYMDPDIMEVESAFYAAMSTFKSYSVEADQLRIQYAGSEILFHRIEDAPTATPTIPFVGEPDPLDDTRWELVAIEDKQWDVSYIPEQIPERERPFVEFKEGKMVLRNTCNNPGADYQVENWHIGITSTERTFMECSNIEPGIMEVEDVFFSAILRLQTYLIEGDQLRIRFYDDGEMRFRRLSE